MKSQNNDQRQESATKVPSDKDVNDFNAAICEYIDTLHPNTPRLIAEMLNSK